MSKGYTIAMFIRVIQSLEKGADINSRTLYDFISPRGGYWSSKSMMFDHYMCDKNKECVLDEVLIGKTARAKKLGKTRKARLIAALKNRKTKGAVF